MGICNSRRRGKVVAFSQIQTPRLALLPSLVDVAQEVIARETADLGHYAVPQPQNVPGPESWQAWDYYIDGVLPDRLKLVQDAFLAEIVGKTPMARIGVYLKAWWHMQSLIKTIQIAKHMLNQVYSAKTCATLMLQSQLAYRAHQQGSAVQGTDALEASSRLHLSHWCALFILRGLPPSEPLFDWENSKDHLKAQSDDCSPDLGAADIATRLLRRRPPVELLARKDPMNWLSMLKAGQSVPLESLGECDVSTEWLEVGTPLLPLTLMYLDGGLGIKPWSAPTYWKMLAIDERIKSGFADALSTLIGVLEAQLAVAVGLQNKSMSGLSTGFLTLATWLWQNTDRVLES